MGRQARLARRSISVSEEEMQAFCRSRVKHKRKRMGEGIGHEAVMVV